MTDTAEIYSFGLPVMSQLLDGIQVAQRVVFTQCHQTFEWQGSSRYRQPTAHSQCFYRWIAFRHRRFKIWRCGHQCALDARCMLSALGPMGHHDTTATVRNQNDGAFDGRDCRFDGVHTARTVDVFTTHRRHSLYTRPFGRQQSLPMLRDMVTQTRHDQDGGCHVQLKRPCAGSLVGRPWG